MVFVKQPEDLRRTLIDASLDLIARKGLAAFSMREAARQAGVSHQAPYHHFADREAILAAIVAEGFQRLRDDMLAAIGKIDDPIARLKAIGAAYVRFALTHPAHFKLMFRSEWVRAERHGDAQSCAQTAFDVLVSVVDDVAKAKYGRADRALALAAWSLAHGLATLMLEGKLEKPCGKGRRAQEIAAQDVLDVFDALLRGA
jgi:AcrR family transcriptional regulator